MDWENVLEQISAVLEERDRKEGKKREFGVISYSRGMDSDRIVLPDYAREVRRTVINRSMLFRGKTAREILNTLVQCKGDRIWIVVEHEDRVFLTVGSWYPELRVSSRVSSVDTFNIKMLLRDYVEDRVVYECAQAEWERRASGAKEIPEMVLPHGESDIFNSRFLKQLWFDLHISYRLHPQAVLHAFDEQIRGLDKQELRAFPKAILEMRARVWRLLKKAVQVPFPECEETFY